MATRKAIIKHSPKFTNLKKQIHKNQNLTMVKNAVVKRWITEDEFTEITGENYVTLEE